MARAKNPAVKKPNIELEYTAQQVLELKICSTNPIYFIKKYVKIQHPVKGAIPFYLYDYQEDIVTAYLNQRFVVILSARQTGKSASSAAFILWFSIFHFDKTVLIASNKNKNAMEMIQRIRFAYENLPFWIKPGIVDDGWNKHSVGFDNGTRIMSEATSETSGRGLSISLLYLDEFAYVKQVIQEEFWTSISPTLSTGGQCIMTSTPNSDSDIFAQIWRGAQVQANGFFPLEVKWDQPPGRDEKFKEEETGRIGEQKWLREYECRFLSSEGQLVDGLFLQTLTQELKHVKPQYMIKDVSFWFNILPGATYLIGVDPSTGTGEDFSVIEVLKFPELVQVGEFRSNTISPNILYGVLKNIINFLETKETTIFFSVESNGVGESIIALYEADENPPASALFVSDDKKKDRKGMVTSSRTKMKTCINFKEMLEHSNIVIRSQILLAELKTFIRHRGSYAAQRGSTDDCISAILVTIRILEEIATYDQAAYNKLYSREFETWSKEDYDGYGEYDEYDEPMPFVT